MRQDQSATKRTNFDRGQRDRGLPFFKVVSLIAELLLSNEYLNGEADFSAADSCGVVVIVSNGGWKHCKTFVQTLEFMSEEDERQKSKCEQFSKYGLELLECIRARAATHLSASAQVALSQPEFQ